MQTAEPVVAATGIEMRTTPALRERSVGVFTGMTFAEAEAAHPEIFRAMMQRDPDACPPEGETSRERAAHVRHVLRRDHRGARRSGRALFVSHAFTLNLCCGGCSGWRASQPTVFFRTDNARCIG